LERAVSVNRGIFFRSHGNILKENGTDHSNAAGFKNPIYNKDDVENSNH